MKHPNITCVSRTWQELHMMNDTELHVSGFVLLAIGGYTLMFVRHHLFGNCA